MYPDLTLWIKDPTKFRNTFKVSTPFFDFFLLKFNCYCNTLNHSNNFSIKPCGPYPIISLFKSRSLSNPDSLFWVKCCSNK